MYQYGITPKELYKARKLIIKDIKSNNKVDKPIENMTLQVYFNMIKECMLSTIDENGVVIDPYGGTTWFSKEKIDIRKLSPIEVAKKWMDGRGLFTEHFNGQLYGNKKHYGNWENIGDRDQNQWYHEDRLNDPLWFKECVSVIGHAGHPTECRGCGNFNPFEYEEDKWCIRFGTFSRSSYYALKAYLYLKDKGFPVFLDESTMYLTKKQMEKLKFEGYIK